MLPSVCFGEKKMLKNRRKATIHCLVSFFMREEFFDDIS
jgi:hypothetical protein